MATTRPRRSSEPVETRGIRAASSSDVLLRAMAETESATRDDIASRTGMEASRVSGLLSRLASRGYLTVDGQEPSDGKPGMRLNRYRLTPSGREQIGAQPELGRVTLAGLRARCGRSRKDIAAVLGVSPEAVETAEGPRARLLPLADEIAALGGRVRLTAVFWDRGPVPLCFPSLRGSEPIGRVPGARELGGLRRALKVTQQEVAERMRTVRPTVSDLELHAESPMVQVLEAYVRALGGVLFVTAQFEDGCDTLEIGSATAETPEDGSRRKRVITIPELAALFPGAVLALDPEGTSVLDLSALG